MGTIYLNMTVVVPDGDDKAAAENEAADHFARFIAEDAADVTSASYTSDTTGMVNLHDRYANLAAQQPAEHPHETGPASMGVGAGTEGMPTPGTKTPARPRSRARKSR